MAKIGKIRLDLEIFPDFVKIGKLKLDWTEIRKIRLDYEFFSNFAKMGKLGKIRQKIGKYG